jgi:hypothetical protein
MATAQTPVGVYCLTLCDECADEGSLPRIGSWTQACDLVMAHCGHRGVDLDTAARWAEEEDRDE